MIQNIKIICELCNNNIRMPVQCGHCKNLFCQECLKKKYLEENQIFCPKCRYKQNFDTYLIRIDLISNYSLNSILYPNYDNNNYQYCIQCMKDFTQNDKDLHNNHNVYPSKTIRMLKINEAIKNLNDIMTFQKYIKSHSLKYLKEIKTIESIKTIKLKEIDIMKNNINKYYNNSKLNVEKLYKELNELNIIYEKLINDYLIQINEIINENKQNEVRNINETIINDISNISKIKKKLENQFKQNIIIQNLKFESFMEEKMSNNEIYKDNESFNNQICLNFINPIYSPKLLIYKSNSSEIIAKIELNNINKDNHFFINVHLQINDSNEENNINIFLNKVPSNNDNKLIYIANIENKELFNSLIQNSPSFSIFISELELS